MANKGSCLGSHSALGYPSLDPEVSERHGIMILSKVKRKNMKIMKIDRTDESRVREFLSGAGGSLKSFRYFEKRPVGCISVHIVTLIGYNDGEPVAYGHLDPENGKTWLGVCVRETSCGKGLGTRMMDALIDEAKAQGIARIDLTVDEDNVGARKLYERYGFVLQGKNGKVTFYARGE
jgi:RimJ/RimL family protein N-acetyltransferase